MVFVLDWSPVSVKASGLWKMSEGIVTPAAVVTRVGENRQIWRFRVIRFLTFNLILGDVEVDVMGCTFWLCLV